MSPDPLTAIRKLYWRARALGRYHWGRDPLRDAGRIAAGRPLRRIADVGANEGQSALRFARRFPTAQIYAFEPTQATYARLVNRTRNNPRITTVHAAVGAMQGQQRLVVNEISVLNSLLDITDPLGRDRVVGGEEVAVVTLDDFTAAHDLPSIDLLKTDTQGYDLHVLQGAARLLRENRIWMVHAELLFAELYREQADFEALYSFLKRHGFKIVSFYNLQHRAEPFLWWGDALFYNPSFVA